MHVFTYGTLMFPEVWRAVVGREFATVGGLARGYAVRCVRGAVFPGMVAAGSDEVVRGVLYLDVDCRSLERLDRFEDDFYERQNVHIACDDGQERAAESYVVPPSNYSALTDEAWCRETFVARGQLAEFVARYAGFARLGGG